MVLNRIFIANHATMITHGRIGTQKGDLKELMMATEATRKTDDENYRT